MLTGALRSSRFGGGFTLTEMAIVIGVVGIMVGGIWTAMSGVMQYHHIAEAAGDVAEVVPNVRSYFAVQTGMMNKKYTTVTQLLAQQQVIPPHMLRDQSCLTNGNCIADGPWGTNGGDANGTFRVCEWTMGTSTACSAAQLTGTLTPQFFGIEFTGLSAGACFGLVQRVASADGPDGLVDVSINGFSMVINNQAVQHIDGAILNTQCGAVTPATVDFVYRLTAATF